MTKHEPRSQYIEEHMKVLKSVFKNAGLGVSELQLDIIKNTLVLCYQQGVIEYLEGKLNDNI